jgi:hypothetical protein
MGIAGSSALVAVSDNNLLFSAFPLTFNMIIYRRGWNGWFLTPLLILLYTMLVTLGGNVQNPLSNYFGSSERNAEIIFEIIFVCSLVGYCFTGWAWLSTLGAQELFPLRKVLPDFRRERKQPQLVYNPTTQEFTVAQTPDKSVTKVRWGVTGLKPSWIHLLVTALYLLGFICVPQIVYDQYIGRPGQEVMAWLVVLFIQLGGGLLYWGYCYWRPDNYVFGLTTAYFKTHDVPGLTESGQEEVMRGTRQRVVWSVVPIIALNLITVLALGGTRVYTPNADPNWIAMISVLGILLVLWLLVVIGVRIQGVGAMTKKTSAKPIDDGGDYYEDISSAPGQGQSSLYQPVKSSTQKPMSSRSFVNSMLSSRK